MNRLNYIVLMIPIFLFLHCFADYHLQGILANMKCKDWWAKQFLNESEFSRSKYNKDYLVALWTHSFEWAFFITIPFLYICIINTNRNGLLITYLIMLLENTLIHAFIDNQKANKLRINLVEDQLFHLIQIFGTWGVYTSFLQIS